MTFPNFHGLLVAILQLEAGGGRVPSTSQLRQKGTSFA